MAVTTTRRTYTADDVAELTAQAAQAQALDAEAREVLAEASALLDATNLGYGWQPYAEQFGVGPLVEALDAERHPFTTANVSYIPQVGYVWNSRWTPEKWSKLNRRTRRDIDNLRRALAACEVAVNG